MRRRARAGGPQRPTQLSPLLLEEYPLFQEGAPDSLDELLDSILSGEGFNPFSLDFSPQFLVQETSHGFEAKGSSLPELLPPTSEPFLPLQECHGLTVAPFASIPMKIPREVRSGVVRCLVEAASTASPVSLTTGPFHRRQEWTVGGLH